MTKQEKRVGVASKRKREKERQCVLKRDSMRACLSVCALLEAQFMQTSLAAVFALHFFAFSKLFAVVVVSQEGSEREREGECGKERGRGVGAHKKCQPGIMCGVVKWKRNCN